MLRRDLLAVAIALGLGVIHLRGPSERELRSPTETERRASAAEAKRARRRARNLKQEEPIR